MRSIYNLKKLFFSLSTILFLSSQVPASKIGSLFQHKTNEGVKWEIFGDPKIHPKYKGSIKDSKPDGSGELTYSNGDKFEGYWKDGEPHGRGTFFWTDGKKYIGFFENGLPKGKGTYYSKTGSKQSGKWEDTKQNFLWEAKLETLKDVENKQHGILSYRKENAIWGWFDYGDEGKDGKYIGEIKDLKPNGYGVFTYGIGKWKGDQYKGMWKNGKFEGQGTLIRSNGETFVGEWKQNTLWNITKYGKLGKILKKYENGLEIKINEKNFKIKKNIPIEKKGKGILYMHTPRAQWKEMGKKWSFTGDAKKHGKYEGEIINGLPNGQGTYSWFNVNKYVGEFKNGMFHGEGVFISLPSKVKVMGEFKRDKEWNAVQTDIEGKTIGKYVNGILRK